MLFRMRNKPVLTTCGDMRNTHIGADRYGYAIQIAQWGTNFRHKKNAFRHHTFLISE